MEIIILILHVTFGIASFLLGKLVFVDSVYTNLYIGTGIALLIAGAAQGILMLYKKSRKLTDKDRVKKIGAIEKKAEMRSIARAKAGYQTLKLSAYLLVMTIMILFFSGEKMESMGVLDTLGSIGVITASIFWIFYLLALVKPEKEK